MKRLAVIIALAALYGCGNGSFIPQITIGPATAPAPNGTNASLAPLADEVTSAMQQLGQLNDAFPTASLAPSPSPSPSDQTF